jgi:hypothetical protein
MRRSSPTTTFGQGLSPHFLFLSLQASQQCFSLTPIQHQPAATSQPAVFFSHNKLAPAISHQPAEQDDSF